MKRNTTSSDRRHHLHRLAVVILVFVTATRCREDDGSIPSALHDEPTPELLAALESIPATPGAPFESLVFKDGTSIKEYMAISFAGTLQQFLQARTQVNEDADRTLTDVIGKMSSIENSSMKPELHQHKSEGPKKPVQDGVAYYYGSDAIASRNTADLGYQEAGAQTAITNHNYKNCLIQQSLCCRAWE